MYSCCDFIVFYRIIWILEVENPWVAKSVRAGVSWENVRRANAWKSGQGDCGRRFEDLVPFQGKTDGKAKDHAGSREMKAKIAWNMVFEISGKLEKVAVKLI